MKVLFLGSNRFETVRIIAEHIKSKYPDWQIDAVDLVLLREGMDIEPFNNNLISTEWTKGERSTLFHFRFLLRKGKFFGAIKNAIIDRKHGFFNSIKHLSESIMFEEKAGQLFSTYDFFHFHFISRKASNWLNFIPLESKVIASFWGSDAYRVPDEPTIFAQREILNRSNIATCHFNQMLEEILMNLGEEYRPKFKTMLFGMKDWMRDKILHFDQMKGRDAFFQRYSIPSGKIAIQIAYSKARIMQHLKVLKGLAPLSDDAKERFHLVIPLTYGEVHDWNEYRSEIEKEAEKSGISFTCLFDYMTDDEVLEMESACEIFINSRTTDALNGTMMEHFTLSHLVISGGWLKYQILKDYGLYMPTFDEFQELPAILESYLIKREELSAKFESNSRIISESFVSSAWRDHWLSLYD